ncbi:MAG: RNA polymerase sigma factor [Clostridia bacterium]|nr:RNA polymerase sigma factor [Clostridia bacterium]
MTDEQIINLYFARSEEAITATGQQYGGYCKEIAMRILQDVWDSEECVNDTYLKAWNQMPPTRPQSLKCFLGRITRNLALNRLDKRNAQKRGGGQAEVSLEELGGVVAGSETVEMQVDENALLRLLNRFVGGLPKEKRVVFVARYWHLYSIEEIAQRLGLSESKVKSILFRVRKDLRVRLQKEGIVP